MRTPELLLPAGTLEKMRTAYAFGADGVAQIDVKNRFQVGDKLEIIHPSGNHIVQLTEMRDLEGAPLTVAPGSGHKVQIPLQGGLAKGMVARFL